MNSCCAMRAPLDCARRRWHFAALGIAAGMAAVAAGSSAARAAELEPFACRSFCTPLASKQLERYRAQGLSAPPGSDIKLGVILWDEYRRVREPRDTADAATAAHVSYSPAMTAAH